MGKIGEYDRKGIVSNIKSDLDEPREVLGAWGIA